MVSGVSNERGNHSSHRHLHRCTDLLPSCCSSLDLGDDEMTRDDIIHMALEAGLTALLRDTQKTYEALERFAVLVAVAEREACANIVENANTPDCGGWSAQGIADDIRARSTK